MIDPKNKIEVFENADALSIATAEFIIKLADESIAAVDLYSVSKNLLYHLKKLSFYTDQHDSNKN